MPEPHDPTPVSDDWAPRTAVAVVLAFVVAALPFAVWQVVTQADEARYTVAAARMIASGDYVVPFSAWGEVRLLKPPLAYWYVVAGFALFGQSVFAVKSVWLLNAVLVLGLTWALARAVGASRAGAAVAVAALAANLVFFQSAVTHIPDQPLVLGIAVALLGFVRLVAEDDPPAWAPWAAWLGVAWAVLAKGLLAALLVVLALALRAAWGRLRLRGRGEVAAILAAAVGAGWWWVAVAIREPEALASQFLGDQVAEKASFDPAAALGAFGILLAYLVAGFLPVLLAALPLRGLTRPGRTPGVVLLAGWAGLVTVVFSFTTFQPARYLLPALPAVAALAGLAFSALGPGEIARRAGRAARLLLALTCLVVAATAAVVYGGASVAAALAALAGGLAVVAALWWLAGTRRTWIALPLLATVLPATVLLTWPAARILYFPAAADYGIAAVRESGLTSDEVAIFAKWRFLDRVGLAVPPIEGYRYADRFRPELLEGAGLALSIDPGHVAEFEALGWRVRAETGAAGSFDAAELWRAIRARDVAGFRARTGERIFIATPPSG